MKILLILEKKFFFEKVFKGSSENLYENKVKRWKWPVPSNDLKSWQDIFFNWKNFKFCYVLFLQNMWMHFSEKNKNYFNFCGEKKLVKLGSAWNQPWFRMAEAIEKFREHYEDILNQKTQVDRKFTFRNYFLMKNH